MVGILKVGILIGKDEERNSGRRYVISKNVEVGNCHVRIGCVLEIMSVV